MILDNYEKVNSILFDALHYVNIYNLPIYLTIYSNSRYYLNEELDTNAVYNFEIIKGYEIEDLILELDYNLSFF